MRLKAITGVVLMVLLVGMLTLAFNIQPVKAGGTIYIRADGRIEPPTANITTTDNITYTLTGNINESIVIERDNIVVDGAGYTLQANGTGIDLSNRSNVTIREIKIMTTSTNYGIYIYYSSGCNIYGNNITNNNYGVFVDGPNNRIYGNNITNNNFGITVGSSNNSIYGNNVKNNYYDGILILGQNNRVYANDIRNNPRTNIILSYCSNNTIYENNITNSTEGIDFYHSSNNTVCGNNITDNDFGIDLYYSPNNRIYGNNITNSYDGIMSDRSSNNVIYHNNFLNNTYQVSVSLSANVWDDGYPSGGNYWSDQDHGDCADHSKGPGQNISGSDGIVDDSYVIDANNTDRYPLMNLWVPYDVAVLNVTPSRAFVFRGFTLSINVTVENQGLWPETFDVTLSCFKMMPPPIEIGRITVYDLAPETSRTLSFAWNTSDFEIGNYTIIAYALPLPDETDTYDNINTDVTVTISERPVGGIWIPIDKLSLLTPYIALASTIILAIVATAVFVKLKKKKQ